MPVLPAIPEEVVDEDSDCSDCFSSDDEDDWECFGPASFDVKNAESYDYEGIMQALCGVAGGPSSKGHLW